MKLQDYTLWSCYTIQEKMYLIDILGDAQFNTQEDIEEAIFDVMEMV